MGKPKKITVKTRPSELLSNTNNTSFIHGRCSNSK